MRQDAWKSIDEHPLKRLDELFSDEGVGTMITRHPQGADAGGPS